MIYNSFLYITLFPFLFLLLHAIKKGPFHEQESFGEPSPDVPAEREPAPAVA